MGGHRRESHALGTGRQDRAADGHRVRARAERRGDDDAVAREPGVERLIHRDREHYLSRVVPDHHDVVDGDSGLVISPTHFESGDRHRAPLAFRKLLERRLHTFRSD